MDIAIIGAGIGGLTLALALRQRGIDAQIYEQADRLTEIGAAVALSANATRELRRLGVLDAAVGLALEPTELIYRDGISGDRIAAHDVANGGQYQSTFDAPYLGIHRADLQKVLGTAVGIENIHLGHRLETFEDKADRAVLRFANGATVAVDLAIGADGVRSVLRQWVTGGVAPRYSGTSAFRGIVPTSTLTELPDPHAIQFWMGEGAHLLHYAIGKSGDDVNFFAVVEGPQTWPDPNKWVVGCEPGEALAGFEGWHPAVRQMIGSGWVDKRWALFVTPPLRTWHRGAAVLIGDAAHAMLPHHGQGANTTIEDAVTLAAMLDGIAPGARDETLRAYERIRRPRTRLIQRSSWDANTALHTENRNAAGRRNAIAAGFPDRFGWIHSHDATAVASKS